MTQWGLDTLFNPAKRHMDEEKRRLQSTREEIGDNSGGKRIDLESGTVHIRRSATDADGDAAPEDAGKDGAATTGTGSGKAVRSGRSRSGSSGDDRRTPSPAAIRAAQRRGRKPR